MNKKHQQVVLITGVSSGFGKACAEYLHQRGYRVYGTSRRLSKFPDVSSATAEPPKEFKLIPMDVTSDEAVKQGIQWILESEGRLDIVVNNAGYGVAGAVEDTTIAEAKAQFETNFFGVVRICRAVLPIMRKQNSGYLITISSMGGLVGIPFQGFYSASKFAIEGLMESLRSEIRAYGVQVVLIEPGDFRTNFTANRRKIKAAEQSSVYETQFKKSLGVMEAEEMKGPLPEPIGPLVEKIVTTKAPLLRYMMGQVSQKVLVKLKKIAPSKIFEWLLMKYYQME